MSPFQASTRALSSFSASVRYTDHIFPEGWSSFTSSGSMEWLVLGTIGVPGLTHSDTLSEFSGTPFCVASSWRTHPEGGAEHRPDGDQNTSPKSTCCIWT